MKNIYTLLLLLLLSTGLSAQLANGTQVPDVTFTDIEGNSHRIKDYLDSGKVVILDIFATWCPPCWTLHANHVLQDIYAAYGPDGTDELVIFSIEGDATTSHNDLLGTGTNTQGDWVTGVEHFIVENNTIPGTFALAYWPTMYIIRPSGAMLLANDYFFANIFDTTGFDYVYDIAFRSGTDASISGNFSDKFFCGSYQQGTFVGQIQNLGTDTLRSATVEIYVNGELARTKAWTGELTEFKSASVSLPGLTFSESSDLDMIVTLPNNTEDSEPFDNVFGWSLIEPKAEQTATLTIHTDFWPEEIAWTVLDPDANIVASSDDLGVLACDATYTQEFPLVKDGCYEFQITDVFGDGLLNGQIPFTHSCGTPNGQQNLAQGAISITMDGEEIYNNISYGEGVTIPFEFTFVSGVKDITDIKGLNVYPNPVADDLTIELNADKATLVGISIVDMMGRTVANEGTQTFQQGLNKMNLNVTNLVQGTYFLRLLQEDAVKTIKFDKM